MTAYDELPYSAFPNAQSHPDHLAALGTLLGLAPAPVESCRVLELGCGRASNLVPMAAGLPGARIVGIDLAERQISDGRQFAQFLGLTNIQLHTRNLLEVTEDLGEFDYILCQGVYSWVPGDVQEKILELYARHLAPQGIGFIVYNVLPGVALPRMVSRMLQEHDQEVRDRSIGERVREARAFLQLLAATAESSKSPYGQFLRETRDNMSKLDDSHVFHIYLGSSSEPVHFLEFCDRLSRHRLAYLCESEFHQMSTSTLAPAVREGLERYATTPLQKLQYLDFVRPRPMRSSLITHQDLEPIHDVVPGKLTEFRLASPLRKLSMRPNFAPGITEAFGGGGCLRLTTGEPLLKAAFVVLEEIWPQSVPFADLLARARHLLGISAEAPGAEVDGEKLAHSLFDVYRSHGTGALELALRLRSCTGSVSTKPVACPQARALSRAGAPAVTGRLHHLVSLSALDRILLELLDGEHDRAAIIEAVLATLTPGKVALTYKGKPVSDERRARKVIPEIVEDALRGLARLGLLVA